MLQLLVNKTSRSRFVIQLSQSLAMHLCSGNLEAINFTRVLGVESSI